MGHELDVAVIGAGPYGLSVAAHLAGRMGVRVFGRPMEIWHARMPPKMLLRSAWEETSLSAANDRGTIDEWAAEVGEPPARSARVVIRCRARGGSDARTSGASANRFRSGGP